MSSAILDPITADDTAGDAATVDAATTDHSAADPVTADPVTADPVTADPITADPITADPITADPITADPITADTTAESECCVDDEEGDVVRFVRVEYPLLVATLGLVCGDRPAAEDAVQEALAKAVVARRRGQRIDSLPAWVRVVASNLLRNRGRSLGRERMALRRLAAQRAAAGVAGDADIADSAVAVQQALDVQQALATLPRRQREAVALYYRLGLSVADTAATMGVADGTVKTLLSRARTQLAAVLGDKDGDRG